MNFSLTDNHDTSVITEVYDRTLREGLSSVKHKIDDVCREWDKIKRTLHDYEYVYTSANPTKNISRFSPISRSYFKMKEILRVFDIALTRDDTVTCLAEAPGGFIQCILETSVETVHGITLISEDKKTPYWNRMLCKEPRVAFHVGRSKDGDLYDFKNILGFIHELGHHTMSLVTGDGGFDNSDDYNNQERNSLKLIYSEIYLALHLQKEGGSFICKLFDTFERETISLLYVLRLCYKEVSFYKPCISRISNSEKYIVCKGFRGYETRLMNHMTHHFEDNHLHLDIPISFYNEIQDYTKLYGDQQKNSIERGLEMIHKRRYLRYPTTFQVDIAKEWCMTNNVPVNTRCQFLR
jgi:23S rRNA U2552 (ribose-2'-O)-methylase RlmE/FtsJ